MAKLRIHLLHVASKLLDFHDAPCYIDGRNENKIPIKIDHYSQKIKRKLRESVIFHIKKVDENLRNASEIA